MFKKLLFEFAGSVVLIFTGCLTAITLQASYMNANAFFMTSIVFGGVYALLYAGFGEISGCHLNPVISIVQFLDGKLKIPGVVIYSLFQLLGGACAGILIWYMSVDKVAMIEYGCTTFYNDNFVKTLILEMISGFVIAGAYLVSQREKEKGGHIPGAFINGIAYASMFCFTFPADHGGVNILKPFAMAIGGILTQQDMYAILLPLAAVFIGSFCGGMFAWFFCANLKPKPKPKPKHESAPKEDVEEPVVPVVPEEASDDSSASKSQSSKHTQETSDHPKKKKKRPVKKAPASIHVEPVSEEDDEEVYEPVKAPKQKKKKVDDDDFFSVDL